MVQSDYNGCAEGYQIFYRFRNSIMAYMHVRACTFTSNKFLSGDIFSATSYGVVVCTTLNMNPGDPDKSLSNMDLYHQVYLERQT